MTDRRPVVLVTAPRAWPAADLYREALQAGGCDVRLQPVTERLDEADLLPLMANVDAIICGDDRLTRSVLTAAPRLRVIAKWGTGIDSIDLQAARDLGVVVRNCPEAFSDPVADTVLGYMLLLVRQLNEQHGAMLAGSWQRRPVRALNECTLGILGFGAIGRAVARRAAACGMRILASGLETPPADVLDRLGVSMVSTDRLLADSDIVTVHADARADNRRLLDGVRLAQMKPGALLINTARGALVDEPALVAALRSGHLGGAALDVFEEEPLPAASPLRQLANVYLAPHNAGASPAAAERVHRLSIQHVLEVLAGQRP